MKKINVLFLTLALFIAVSANAQTDNSKESSDTQIKTSDEVGVATDSPGMSALMNQLVNGIDAGSFKEGEAGRSAVLGMLTGVEATDFNKYALAVGSLTGALNSNAFLDVYSKNEEGLLYQLQNAVSVSDVAGTVLELSDMINPSSFTKEFVNSKDMWRTSLESISMTK